jgi:hypothetical protein
MFLSFTWRRYGFLQPTLSRIINLSAIIFRRKKKYFCAMKIQRLLIREKSHKDFHKGLAYDRSIRHIDPSTGHINTVLGA